jgi:hypothetical protein
MTAQVVLDVLIADSGVTAIVEDRVSPLIRAQDESLPCVTLSTVDVVPANCMADVPTLDTNRVQVDSWDTTYEGVLTLATACRAALEAAGHTMEGQFSKALNRT